MSSQQAYVRTETDVEFTCLEQRQQRRQTPVLACLSCEPRVNNPMFDWQYVPTYGDNRQLMFCAFCGGQTGTRDHCPSLVMLDKPYPDNLPVVPACSHCNERFSLDEEYLACLISCALAGSTEPELVSRAKIQNILARKPALRARLEQSRIESESGVFFRPEHERVLNVITKLAQGHALYELHEPQTESPDAILVKPLIAMDYAERCAFETPTLTSGPFPEVGSRAMQRLFIIDDAACGGWLEVQPGRYRFQASWENGVEIRIIIHEYLAGYVRWNP